MVLTNIQERCKEKGVSLSSVEKLSDLKPNTIYRWADHMPSADRLARVARVLGTTVEDLLEDEDGKQAINS